MAKLHQFDLQASPFKMIKAGHKIYEMRLYDERRRLIQPGDQIEFIETETKEKLLVSVTSLHIFNSFKDLYEYYNPTLLGYTDHEEVSYRDMEKYYSPQKQALYKVVAIKIALIS